MREQSSSKAPYRAFPQPIRTHNVRLVVPLRDNVTGKIKDTVVEHLRGGEPFIKAEYGFKTPVHTRWIKGLDIRVPWPESEMRVFEAEAVDTRRVDVDAVSFCPSLAGWAVPDSAVDELRNKYSSRRNVHTQEYVQQKMREDAEEYWKTTQRMLSPQQEYWERRAKQKAVKGRAEVTAETLNLIKDMQAARLGEPRERIVGPAS
jgi:large subunit ribosomal protein L24